MLQRGRADSRTLRTHRQGFKSAQLLHNYIKKNLIYEHLYNYLQLKSVAEGYWAIKASLLAIKNTPVIAKWVFFLTNLPSNNKTVFEERNWIQGRGTGNTYNYAQKMSLFESKTCILCYIAECEWALSLNYDILHCFWGVTSNFISIRNVE